jgi:hypothetical protein
MTGSTDEEPVQAGSGYRLPLVAQPEVAHSNLEALVAYYEFSLEDFDRARDRTVPGVELPEHLKSFVHEQVHLFHSTTTPFGLLVWKLRQLQGGIVAYIMRTLKLDLGLPIRLPLLRYVSSLPESSQARFHGVLQTWHDAEFFITISHGRPDTVWASFEGSTYVRGRSILEVQRSLDSAVERNDKMASELRRKARGSLDEALTHNLTVPPVFGDRAEGDVPGSPSARLERAYLSFYGVADEFASTVAVLESAGYSIELWWSDGTALDQLAAGESTFGLDYVYQTPLALTLRGMHTRNPKERILTHLAVCELSLFGPVLPQMTPLRRGESTLLEEVLPSLRFLGALGQLDRVDPVRGVDDYSRFTDEVCSRLGWTPPREIVHGKALLPEPFEIREALYHAACDFRQVIPGLFIDPNAIILDLPHGVLPAYKHAFSFPVMQFRDTVLFHTNKDWLRAYTMGYLLMAAFRKAMLSRSRILQLPWRSDREEVEFLEERLHEQIANILGFDIRPFRIEWMLDNS